MNALSYIRKIEKRQRRSAGFAAHEWLYALRVAPSCPPSKTLFIRGGRNYLGWNPGWAEFDDYEQRAYTVPNLSATLDDPASVTPDVAFSVGNSYQFFLLELKLPAVVEEPTAEDWSFNLHGTGDEFDTAGEAEAWLHSESFQDSEAWYHDDGCAYPLCGLVLRNDGNIGSGCNILPVDMVNRGRSYIWPRDMRPLQLISI